MENHIEIEKRDGIIIVRLNRPSKLNALNRSVISDLGEIVHQLNFEDEYKAMIITGSGDKAFAAGADISEFTDYPTSEAMKMAQKGHDIFREIETSKKPVIAAVNGFALGGGCELAMACHLRIASQNARFGQPEATLGLIPGYGGTQRMIQLIGKAKAMEVLLTGDMIAAEDAEILGLVNKVVEKEDLMEECFAMLKRILSKGPLAIEKTIEAVNAYFEEGVDGFAKEVELFGECFGTEDFKEGTTAFLEKRKPQFKGL